MRLGRMRGAASAYRVVTYCKEQFMSQKIDEVSEIPDVPDEDERARNQETLPGFLFALFILAMSATGIVWLLVASMNG
jgi:hypothetical protein